MTFTFAALFALLPQTPAPRPSSMDQQIAALVTRICDWQSPSREADIATLQSFGVYGVRWLVQGAMHPDPDLPVPSMLIWFQPKGANIAEELLPGLREQDDRARLWWAVALANVTPPAVDVLLREFQSSDRERRLAAVRAARTFVEHHESVAPKLAPLLDDPDADVRYWATFALGRLAPTSLPALFGALKNKDPRVRAPAAEGIQKSFYPYPTPNPSDRGGFSSWHGLPPGMDLRETSTEIVARDGLEPLRAALRDEDEDVRFFAAMALYELGPRAIAARPDLERAVTDANAGVRTWAARALERTDPTPWIRLRRLARDLQKGGKPPEPLDDATLAKLVTDLEYGRDWTPVKKEYDVDWSPERDVRFEAAREITLRALDPLLARAARQGTLESESAARTLDAVERELDRRIYKLMQILDSIFGAGEPTEGALVSLGSAAVPALESALLRYPRFPIGCPTYYEFADALAKLGEPAVPVSAIGLGHWYDAGRIFSTQAFLAAGEKAAPLTPAVVSAWRTVGLDARIPGTDGHWDSKLDRLCTGYSGPATTRAMKQLGPRALPVLIRALDDLHAVVRMRAAASLGSYGSGAKSALPALARRLTDDQAYVALAVADAIVLIAPGSPEAEAARAQRAALGAK